MVGDVTTTAPVVDCVPLLHEYVVPPLALSVTATPLQMVVLGVTVTEATGADTTVTKTLAVSQHPVELFVAMTVYAPEEVGATAGFCEAEVNPFGPFHTYVFPLEEAVSVNELPEHTVSDGFAAMVGVGSAFTTIFCTAFPLHPLVVPVTVYVVLLVGVTTGLGQLVQLNPVDGDQV